MDQQVTKRIKDAVENIYKPSADNAQRQDAQNYLESLKSNKNLPLYGLYLANLNNDCSQYVRNYSLLILEDNVKTRWAADCGYSIDELHQIRNGVVELYRQYANANDQFPKYLKENLAHLMVEIAKRSWFYDWPEFNDLLRQMYEHVGVSVSVKIFVLSILRQLVEDVFVFEDSQAILRKRELSVVLQCIFVSQKSLNERNRLYGTTASAEKQQENFLKTAPTYEEACQTVQGPYEMGWLNVLVEQLSLQDSSLQVEVLKLLQCLMNWVSPLALVETNCIPSICNILQHDNVSLSVKVHALNCLLALECRPLPSLIVESVDLRRELIFEPILSRFSNSILSNMPLWLSKATSEDGNNLLNRLAAVLEVFCCELGSLKQPADSSLLQNLAFDSFLELLRQLSLFPNAAVSCQAVEAWLHLYKLPRGTVPVLETDACLLLIWRMLVELAQAQTTISDSEKEKWADLETLSLEDYDMICRHSVNYSLEVMKCISKLNPRLLLDKTFAVFLSHLESNFDSSADDATLEKARQEAALFEIAFKSVCECSDTSDLAISVTQTVIRSVPAATSGFSKSRILSALSIPTRLYENHSDLLLAALRFTLDVTVYRPEPYTPDAVRIRSKAFQVLHALGKALPNKLVPMYNEFGSFAQNMLKEQRYSMVEMGKMMEFAAALLYFSTECPFSEKQVRFQELFSYSCESWQTAASSNCTDFDHFMQFLGYNVTDSSFLDAENFTRNRKTMFEALYGLKSAMTRTMPSIKGNQRCALSPESCREDSDASLWKPFLYALLPQLVQQSTFINMFVRFQFPDSVVDTASCKNLTLFIDRLREEVFSLLGFAMLFPDFYAPPQGDMIRCLLYGLPNAGGGLVEALETLPLRNVPFVVGGIVKSFIVFTPSFATQVVESFLPVLLEKIAVRFTHEWTIAKARAQDECNDESDDVETEMTQDRELRFASRAVCDMLFCLFIPASSTGQTAVEFMKPSSFYYPNVAGIFSRNAQVLEATLRCISSLLSTVADSISCTKLLTPVKYLISLTLSESSFDGLVSGTVVAALLRLLQNEYHVEIQNEAINLLYKVFKAYSTVGRGAVFTQALMSATGGSIVPSFAELQMQIASAGNQVANEKKNLAIFRKHLSELGGVQLSQRHKTSKALVVSTTEKMYFNRAASLVDSDSKANAQPQSPTRRKDITDTEDNGIATLFS